jgi:molybdate transport system substrate-binding protein
LVARGEIELGFQQLSELLDVPGVDVVGPLPPPVQIVTTFSAAVAASSLRAESARGVLDFLVSPATQSIKRRHGMDPA